MKMNKEQQIVYSDIISQTYNKYLLTAKGGCGKTFLTSKIIINRLVNNVNVTVLAPSHTAKSVLSRGIKDAISQFVGDRVCVDKLEIMTIAKALGKIPNTAMGVEKYNDSVFVSDNARISLLSNVNDDYDPMNLLVIEEISMVGLNDLKLILEIWQDRPVLFVGDFRQIPPVNSLGCLAWMHKQVEFGEVFAHKLSINMRSDLAISQFCDDILINKGIVCNKDKDAGNERIVFYDDAKLFNSAFKTAIEEISNITAIAYTNRAVSKYLELGKKSGAYAITPGSLVRLHEPITVNYNNGSRWITEIVANNGDIVKVVSVNGKFMQDNLTKINKDICMTSLLGQDFIYKNRLLELLNFGMVIDYINVELAIISPADGSNIIVRVPANISDCSNAGKTGAYGRLFTKLLTVTNEICEEIRTDKIGKGRLKALLSYENGSDGTEIRRLFKTYEKRIKDKKKLENAKCALIYGRIFYAARGLFSNITPMYAITAHKSQGQSIDTVFCDSRDINRVTDDKLRVKLLYVACSRAKGRLHILV